MKHRTLYAAIAVFLGSCSLVHGEQRTQSFDNDPGWEGVKNRLLPAKMPQITQDFGYNANKGEMGGVVTRASTPAYYADKVGPLTLDDPFSASGTFALTKTTGSSGIFFGFFKGDQPGATGRPIGSIGMDFDGEGGGSRLAVRLITAKNQSCGTFIT